MHDREQQIRERAYGFWEQAGRPEGRDQEFWAQAYREFEADQTGDDPAPYKARDDSVRADPSDDAANTARTARAAVDQLGPSKVATPTAPSSAASGEESAPEKRTRKPL